MRITTRLMQFALILSLSLFFLPADAVEWHLTFNGGSSLSTNQPKANQSSVAWEAKDEGGFVFVTILESNETRYDKPPLYTFELGLEAWLSQQWGLSLICGYTPMHQKTTNQYRFDFIWYDDESGFEYRLFSTSSNLNRFYADLLLNHRLFLGDRSSLLLSAGIGAHRFSGRIERDFGWAAAAIGDRYYVDFFKLPLRAETKQIHWIGQARAAFEYRLSRVVTGRVGIAYWFGGAIDVPYRLYDEGNDIVGEEGHMALTDVAGLLNENELQKYVLDPKALRLTIGLSIWL